MPKSPRKLRSILKKMSVWIFGIYIALSIADMLLPQPYGLCNYTERMGGKEAIYNNEKYKVVLCGVGTYGNDHIRMQIFSEKGNLLAQRKFLADWEFGEDANKLEYKADRIIYSDFSIKSYEGYISMPPTALDWMRARIPLLD